MLSGMNLPIIFLGSDHGGFELKTKIEAHLSMTYKIQDLGTYTPDSVDYPLFAQKVACAVLAHQNSVGILVCGTGIGISIAANRFNGIRAALVYDSFTAQMAKRHNNANILCLGGRTTPCETAFQLVDIWLNEPFEAGRHQNRLDLMDTKSECCCE